MFPRYERKWITSYFESRIGRQGSAVRRQIRGATSRRKQVADAGGILRSLVASIMFTMALIGFNACCLDGTKLGDGIERLTYDLLQGRLTSKLHADELPVVVVDIGNLTRKDEGGPGESVTPRDKLIEILKAIALEHPAAIGLDIDFSPDYGAYANGDSLLFAACQLITQGSGLQRGIPVFLGAGRTQTDDPDHWLPGAPESLATAIMKPHDIRRMVSWVWKDENPEKRRPSMSTALANASGSYLEHPTGLLRFLDRAGIIEGATVTAVKGAGISVEEFLVDYAPLDLLGAPANLLVIPKSAFDDSAILKAFSESWKDRLEGKLVLVGNATTEHAVDYFTVPDHARPVPGVLVQASAVYTLMMAPLYELSVWARPVIDVILSLIVFGTLAAVRWHSARQSEMILAVHRVRVTLTIAGVLVVMISAMLVHVTRIVWDDFIVVILTLLVHSPLERYSEGLWHWARKVAPASVTSIFFDRDSRRHR